MWLNDEPRLLSDVAEGLILSSENLLSFYAKNMISVTNVFKESMNWLKH